MKYQWILFDADETLFSFDSFLGLKNVLASYGVDFNWQDYETFQSVNKPLWVAYQNKEIDAKALQQKRFAKISQQVGVDPLVLNLQLMDEMALISQPLVGVMDLLNQLSGKVKLGIITNGFSHLQQKRLENTGTKKFFDLIVVSEEIGVAKPDPNIFEYAFKQMNVTSRTSILMVGDTLASDILGGINAGIDTCWYNPSNQINTTVIQPTYEISAMRQLLELLEK